MDSQQSDVTPTGTWTSPFKKTLSHYSPLRSYCETQKFPWKSAPTETLLEKKTLYYINDGTTLREQEFGSSLNPYFTDSDRDLVVETETLILRQAEKSRILDMNTGTLLLDGCNANYVR